MAIPAGMFHVKHPDRPLDPRRIRPNSAAPEASVGPPWSRRVPSWTDPTPVDRGVPSPTGRVDPIGYVVAALVEGSMGPVGGTPVGPAASRDQWGGPSPCRRQTSCPGRCEAASSAGGQIPRISAGTAGERPRTGSRRRTGWFRDGNSAGCFGESGGAERSPGSMRAGDRVGLTRSITCGVVGPERTLPSRGGIPCRRSHPLQGRQADDSRMVGSSA